MPAFAAIILLLVASIDSVACVEALPGPGSFEVFSPVFSSVRAKTNSTAAYPAAVDLTVPWKGKLLELQLKRQDNLFAKDWSMETYNDAGDLISHETEPQMCHYQGTVKGDPNSQVAISVCDGIGILGSIHTSNLALGVKHVDYDEVSTKKLLRSDDHIIHQVSDDFQDYTDLSENSVVHNLSLSKKREYTIRLALLANKELSTLWGKKAENLITNLVNGAQAVYNQNTWFKGATVKLQIAHSVSNPSIWPSDPEFGQRLLPGVSKMRKSVPYSNVGDNHVLVGLIKGKTANGKTGNANAPGKDGKAKICTKSGNAIVAAVNNYKHGHLVLAHEVGHVIGLSHYDTRVSEGKDKGKPKNQEIMRTSMVANARNHYFGEESGPALKKWLEWIQKEGRCNAF